MRAGLYTINGHASSRAAALARNFPALGLSRSSDRPRAKRKVRHCGLFTVERRKDRGKAVFWFFHGCNTQPHLCAI